MKIVSALDNETVRRWALTQLSQWPQVCLSGESRSAGRHSFCSEKAIWAPSSRIPVDLRALSPGLVSCDLWRLSGSLSRLPNRDHLRRREEGLSVFCTPHARRKTQSQNGQFLSGAFHLRRRISKVRALNSTALYSIRICPQVDAFTRTISVKNTVYKFSLFKSPSPNPCLIKYLTPFNLEQIVIALMPPEFWTLLHS